VIKLSERDQKVLEAVITDYIQSGDPVGSRTISKRFGLKVSSATIRNVMADLEELGLLYQPHTSAGRFPTKEGLRLYLDSIMQLKELAQEERALISKAYEHTVGDLSVMMRHACRILSHVCNQVGVVLWPRLATTRLKHIELIRLRPGQILTIFISKTGLVQHNLVAWEEEITQEELDKYARYLNDLLHDLPIAEVRRRILEEMEDEKALFDELFTRALQISEQAFQPDPMESDVFIEGQINLLNSPEFADVERMRHVLAAFEDKSRIVRLLDMTLDASGSFQIILGPESELADLSDISLIAAPYRRGDTSLGVLGVIGPLRMDYSRIIPVVEFTARLLSRQLESTD
jgi:heat-inducible transcriptional repressor